MGRGKGEGKKGWATKEGKKEATYKMRREGVENKNYVVYYIDRINDIKNI